MFDCIICEFPLPNTDKELQEEEFQTKSFECLLETYVITKDRKLILKEKNEDKIIPYHGDIIFYTSTGNHEDKTYQWHEYLAHFTHGKLEYIKKVKKQ